MINILKFGHNKASKIFYIDASNFSCHRVRIPECLGIGFEVVDRSAKEKIIVCEDHKEYEPSHHKLIWTDFTIHCDIARKHPRLKGYKFRIFNH